jgi:pimeloyl-ACP methyl ester carboxylesterase
MSSTKRRLASLVAGVVAAALAPTAGHADEAVTIAGPGGTLAGSYIPADPGGPVVVLIPGSGPTDRDGNSPLGVAGGAYRRLAEALADKGVASIRIDKRGMFGSSAAAADPNAVRMTDYAADVRAWAAEARRRTGAPCAWLLGHSEGGLVAILAAQDSPDVCGLVLLAAPGRPLQQVIREQVAANPANALLLPQVDRVMGELEAGRIPDLTGVHPAVAALFDPRLNTFFISLFSHDPAEELGRYAGPVLVVQGETDIQVTLADAERLAAARGVEPVVIPGMNHVLRDAPADRLANIATYRLTDAPLSAGLAEAIAGFITGR